MDTGTIVTISIVGVVVVVALVALWVTIGTAAARAGESKGEEADPGWKGRKEARAAADGERSAVELTGSADAATPTRTSGR